MSDFLNDKLDEQRSSRTVTPMSDLDTDTMRREHRGCECRLQVVDQINRLCDEVESLRAERDVLADAVIKYGRHTPDCGYGIHGADCRCGLQALSQSFIEEGDTDG